MCFCYYLLSLAAMTVAIFSHSNTNKLALHTDDPFLVKGNYFISLVNLFLEIMSTQGNVR